MKYITGFKLIFVIPLFLSLNLVKAQTFTEQTGISLAGNMECSVSWSDLDNDGYLDIIVIGRDGAYIYKNNGNNTFTEQTAHNLSSDNYSAFQPGDYDNDGDLDILFKGSLLYKNDGNFIFVEQTSISLPGGMSAEWGDYDNDGDLDILLPIYDDVLKNASRIYINNGDNTFTENTGIHLSSVSGASAAWGDYDNDGDLDILLTGDHGDEISKIYKNNGDNTFTEQTDIFIEGISKSSVEWGDYDNDGDLDILMAGQNTDGYITKIYKNYGGQSFSEHKGISLPGLRFGSTCWGDYDNDGDLDILLTGNYLAKIFTNNGDDTFTELTDGSLNGIELEFSSAAWGDYDNDGDLDILLSGEYWNEGHITKVYRNNSVVKNTVPEIPINLQSEIIDDGARLSWNRSADNETPDIALEYNVYISETSMTEEISSPHALITSGSRLIAKMGNIRDTSWLIKNLDAGTYYWSVQAIDKSFAGSAFANENSFIIGFSNSISPTDEQSLLPDEIGTSLIVTETIIADSRQWKYGLAPGGPYNYTIDGETALSYTPGFPDGQTYNVVCVSTYNGISTTSNEVKISVYQFEEQKDVSFAEFEDGKATWGDYNNDGNLDLLYTGRDGNSPRAYIYMNNGNNTFTEQTNLLSGAWHDKAAWADFNMDSYLDVFLFDHPFSVPKLYNNNWNNTFTEQPGIFVSFISNCSVDIGDYDNDGDIDILLAGQDENNFPMAKIYKNHGSSFYEQSGINLPGVLYGSVAWGDYDKDGDLDILMSGNSNHNSIAKIYKNNGDNSFSELSVNLASVSYSSAAWGDYDSDGDLDILLTGRTAGYPDYNPVSKIYKNNGNDSFIEQTDVILTGIQKGSASWGDYDNDGDLDILLSGSSGSDSHNPQPVTKIYKNNGNNTFTELVTALPGIYDGITIWGDYDKDGDLDIFLCGTDENEKEISKLYKNNQNLVNQLPSAPTNLSTTVNGDKVNFEWNTSNDNETVTDALNYNIYISNTSGNVDISSPHADISTGFRRIVSDGMIKDTNWQINNLESGTYYWSVQAIDQAFAGSGFATENSFTVDVFNNSIAPITDQQLLPGVNGTNLSVTVSETVDSYQWKYSESTGGPYNNIVGATSNNYAPNFSVGGIYYVVCVSTLNGISRTSNGVKVTVTQFTRLTPDLPLPVISNQSIDWGDYDNDGDLDILFAIGRDDDTTCIYINNGNHTFSLDPNAILTNLDGGGVSWGDYDNDGDLDVLLAGYGSEGRTAKVFLQQNNNTFIEVSYQNAPFVGVYSGGWYFNCKVDWCDFDNDGELDCIITGYDDNSKLTNIYWNNGRFVNANAGLKPSLYFDIADYNKDKYPDLLVGNTIYKNNRDGTFIEQTDIEISINGQGAWGDYDNDGDYDILIKSKIYSNQDNTFVEQDIPSLHSFENGQWGDFDNDGDLDILTTDKIFKNNGNNSFSVLGGYDGNGVCKWGDYDNDGDLDIVVANNVYRNNNLVANTAPGIPENLGYEEKGGGIRLYWDAVSGDETPSQSLSYNVRIGSSPGAFDIVSPMSNLSDGFHRISKQGNAFLNNEFQINNLEPGIYYWSVQTIDNGLMTSEFSAEETFEVHPVFMELDNVSLGGVDHGSVAWGDCDNDGDLDILLTGNYPYVYLNQGNKTFNESKLVNSDLSLESGLLNWGDYNSDNYLDVMLTGDVDKTTGIEPTTNIFLNNQDNTFTEQTSLILDGIYDGSTAWGDYDNDGDLDVLITGHNGTGRISKIYQNNTSDGQGFIEQTGIALEGVMKSSVVWGDYDNDGDMDILLAGNSASGNISKIYENEGNNLFTDRTEIILAGVSDGSVCWGDINNDNYLDILLTGKTDTGGVSILYKNNGPPDYGYTNINAALPSIYYSASALGDYNNDGYLDILLCGRNETVITKVFKNNKDETFSEVSVDIIGIEYGSVAWGDYDNDGDLDFCIGGNTVTKIYENHLNHYNSPPTAPGNLNSVLTGFDLDLSWDEATDEQSQDSGLSYNLKVGTSSGGTDILSPMSNLVNGYRFLPTFGNVQMNTYWKLKNLSPGQTYYWSVQAIDQSFTGGEWSTEQFFEMPNISADFNTETVCFGTSTIFIDISLSPEEAITSWNWDFDDGNTSTDQNPTHLYAAPGTYSVNLNIQTASYTHSITKEAIVIASPNAIFSVDTVCQTSETTYINSSNLDEVNVESWLWELGDGAIFEVQHPPKHFYSDPGSYQVKLKIIADNGCVDSTERNAVVVNLPSGTITYEGGSCYDINTSLNAEQNNLYSYQWYYNDIIIEGATSYSVHPEQDGIYKVEITPPACNMVSPTYNLNYTDGPDKPEMYLRGPVVWYIACSNITAETYRWYKNGVEIPNSNTQIIVPNPADGSYYVELNDGGECWTKSETVVIPDDFGTGKFKSFEELANLQDVESGMAIFPNPNNGKFSLLFKDDFTGKIYIRIKDINGKTIRQYYSDKALPVYFEEMDLNNYGSGVYFIEIEYDSKKDVKKVVVK